MSKNLLMGAVCLDVYKHSGTSRVGCGILHNAYHLQQQNVPFQLITRIGDQHSEQFLRFFEHNQLETISENLIQPGNSASILIDLQPSGEAIITGFDPGVWKDFRLSQEEEDVLDSADNLHMVMVDEVIPEFIRVSRAGLLEHTRVSGDFLAFEHFSAGRFAELLPYMDIAFIGWKGQLTEPLIQELSELVKEHNVMLILTMGARGIQVFDTLTGDTCREMTFDVDPVEVKGSTNGCGDTFIAYFLASYWANHDLEMAIEHGKRGGAKATEWVLALPDSAYNPLS